MTKNNKIIKRGGNDLERLYLHDHTTKTANGRTIEFKKTVIPGMGKNMGDVNMRHLGRYGFVLPFIRPGYHILDFPCGSGIATEVFALLVEYGEFSYEGWDFDPETIIYAAEVYSKKYLWAHFQVGDLTNFQLDPEAYNTICCIEGLEHIEHNFQISAVPEFVKGLKQGGTFIVSSPPPESGVSSPNPKNEFHKWELTKEDLLKLLSENFGEENVELVTQEDLLTTGQLLTCFYAICHKR